MASVGTHLKPGPSLGSRGGQSSKMSVLGGLKDEEEATYEGVKTPYIKHGRMKRLTQWR